MTVTEDARPSVLGQRLLRREDPALLTGEAKFSRYCVSARPNMYSPPSSWSLANPASRRGPPSSLAATIIPAVSA